MKKPQTISVSIRSRGRLVLDFNVLFSPERIPEDIPNPLEWYTRNIEFNLQSMLGEDFSVCAIIWSEA